MTHTHTPTDTHADSAERASWWRQPNDLRGPELFLLTGIAAGLTWLLTTRLLSLDTSVALMLTGIVFFLTARAVRHLPAEFTVGPITFRTDRHPAEGEPDSDDAR